MPRSDASLELREIDPVADARWDAYVGSRREGTVYHRSGWLRALQREYGRAALGLALEDGDGGLRGVLPLMATRGLPLGRGGELAGRRLASLPRTPLAGPLADDRAGLDLLVRGARERLPAGARLQLKLREPALHDVDLLQAQEWRMSYARDLPSAGGQLRFGGQRNHSRIRSKVNAATRAGVSVRAADGIDDVRAWYALYLATMRDHLVPARPWRLFAALWELLAPRGEMRLLLAERGGCLLAGSVLLMSGSTVFYAFNGCRRSALALHPNDVLQWRAMHDAAAEGYERYDLGEVPDGDEGLAQFKRKWGTEPSRLWRYSFPPADPAADVRAARGNGAAGHGASRARDLAQRAWLRVPLPATALAGRLVYRYL